MPAARRARRLLTMSMDPVLRQICTERGVFLRREAEALGYHDHAMAGLVRSGSWHRVRRGAYTYRALWEPLSVNERYGLLCRAAVRQANTGVLLSHLSSANEWGAPLWDVDLKEVHLTRLDGRTGRREAGVRQHRGKILDGDETERSGIRTTSATRTALELTTLLDVEHSLVEIDALLQAGMTTPELLRERYSHMQRWPETLRTDLVLRLVDGRAESVGETRVRYLCWCQHLPAPIPNYPIRDRNGREIFRVDLAWPELGLFLEFDGKEKYHRLRRPGETIEDTVLREKQRESTICELTGWRCIRIVWADLYRPVQTAARIRALMRPAAA